MDSSAIRLASQQPQVSSLKEMSFIHLHTLFTSFSLFCICSIWCLLLFGVIFRSSYSSTWEILLSLTSSLSFLITSLWFTSLLLYVLCVENYSQRETYLSAAATAFIFHVKEMSLSPVSHHISLLCSLTLSVPNSEFKKSYWQGRLIYQYLNIKQP